MPWAGGRGGNGGSLSTGAMAGLTVGITIVAGVLATAAFIMYGRQKKAPNRG